jgi:hypothetical protein
MVRDSLLVLDHITSMTLSIPAEEDPEKGPSQ